MIDYDNNRRSNMPKYEKIENILKIINILDKSHYPVDINTFARELNVNKKSIYRYIDTINQAGIPITPVYNENGKSTGKYQFFNDFNMKKIKVTKEEITLLVILYEFTKKLKNKFNESFQAILNKVITGSEKDCYYIKIPDGINIQKNDKITEDIEKAINSGNKLKIKYIKVNGNKEYSYKVSPIRIIFFDGFWYLLAVTEKNKYLIKYRIDNIKSLSILNEKIDSTINIKSMLEKSVNIFFTQERNVNVKLKIDKEAGIYFKQKSIFPEQKIIEELDDGLILETSVCQFIEILHIICQWIPHVYIIEPKEYNDELKNILSSYLEKI
jgi:predicted DNA-binding transcriptional regulator YafY